MAAQLNPLSLDKARQDATEAAFRFVTRGLATAADLESLENLRHAALINHGEKIAILKARVQAIVSSIETGIDDLKTTAERLDDLLLDIERLVTESKRATSQISDKYARDLKSLSVIWERVVTVDSLITKFEEVDSLIASVQRFFQERPNGFSIRCFQAIRKLLEMKDDLMSHAQPGPDSDIMVFLADKFKPALTAMDQLKRNVTTCLESAFAGGACVDADLVIRANWILCAMGKREEESIETLLMNALRAQFQECLVDATAENLRLQLQKLNKRIEALPEQLESVMPALPHHINAFDLLSQVANTQIVDILKTFRTTLKPTAFLIVTLIKSVKEIQCTLRALLGLEPSEEFMSLQMELTTEFDKIIISDYCQILDRIITLDEESIQKKQGRYLVTPAPFDFMKGLEDAEAFVNQSDLNVFRTVQPRLISNLIRKIDELASRLSPETRTNYLIACVNNSLDGTAAVSATAKSHPDLLSQDETLSIRQAWAKVQRSAMNSLSEMVYKRVMDAGKWLLENFSDKCDMMRQGLEDIGKDMVEPLFRKTETIFCRAFVARFIRAHNNSALGDMSLPDFVAKAKGDADMLIQVLTDLDYPGGERHAKVVESFRDFMTWDPKEAYLSYLEIAKEFTDFSPNYAWTLFKCRPDGRSKVGMLAIDEEIKKTVNQQYATIARRPEDSFFTEPGQDKPAKDSSGKKPGKKLFS
jgi:ribosomal protein L17